MQVEDAGDVDWDEVAQTVGKVTPVCVRKSFYRLKVSKVPNWTSLSYGEIIDFLQLRVVPLLMEKLQKCSSVEALQEAQEAQEAQKDTFLLSEVLSFQDEEDEKFMEVDNSQRNSGRSGRR